jgi:hypothetical protein
MTEATTFTAEETTTAPVAIPTETVACKINVMHDEYCNDLFEYYEGKGTAAKALRGQAGFLEWHVEQLRKLADVIDEVGEDQIDLDVDDLMISVPSGLVERLEAEDLASPLEIDVESNEDDHDI